MGALAVVDAERGWEDAGRGDGSPRGSDDVAGPAQPRLFALPGGPADAPAAPSEVIASAAPARVAHVRTLEDIVAGAWAAVSVGETSACPLCGGSLRARWSAGAGVVGGRCGDCGTSLE
jgi:hypothetical protein